MIRQPIVVVIGHVDHGKTTVLDRIRQTSIAAGEAGGITQENGATFIPRETIEEICGELLEKMNIELKIPGLLIVDTPGHEAFTTMRKRGGSIADIAILIIDINEGIMPQTIESIEILKNSKVPFIVAANKIDRMAGWRVNEKECFSETIKNQTEDTKKLLDKEIYKLVGELYKYGFSSERFDRVDDFTKQILIIPTSGKTGEGVAELLMFLAGLAQKYIDLNTDVSGFAKGTVLEVKEEKGLGTTLDVIIYDGKLSVNDQIVVGGKEKPIVTKVKALLQPAPLQEIREKKQFQHVESVTASVGVKIAAPGLENALAGSTVMSCDDAEKACEEVAKEVQQIEISTNTEGAVVKCDSLGSLEAIVNLFKKDGIPIRRAAIGPVTRRDIVEAGAVRDKDRYLGVVFAFNSIVLEEAKEEQQVEGVHVFETNVIYRLVEEYAKWKKTEKAREKQELLKGLLYPMKLQILKGYVFRQSKPAIVGVEILEGILKTGTPIMNQKGKRVGKVRGIQKDKENVSSAEVGEQVACSIEGATVGRQIKEGDVLFTNIPLKVIPNMEKTYKNEAELLTQIKEIKKTHKEEPR